MALYLKDIKVQRGDFGFSIHELRLDAAKVHFLTGPSGCGKSTLFDAISGFLPLESGEISVDEKRLDGLPPEKRQVARVFQRSALFPHLTVKENVAFGLRVMGMDLKEKEGLCQEWLRALEIESLGERSVGELSGGQAQRVALARALVMPYPVLLLDEPETGLDPELRDVFLKLVESHVEKTRKHCLWIHHERTTRGVELKFEELLKS